MRKFLASVIVLSTVALVSFKGEKAAVYKVDAQKSKLVWTGQKVTGEHKGAIPLESGSFTIADQKLSGGSFELNVAGLTVTDITDKDGNAKLVGHLKSDDFFSTEKFPKAKFVITTVVSKGGDNYDVNGDLTIKGITKPLSFPAVVKVNGKTLSATGKITVNRAKYDIKFKSSSFFENLGDKAIYDDFILDVNLVAAL